MKILGINVGHDASVCVLDESGELLYSVGEERFNRIKSFTGWPYESLKTVNAGSYHVVIANNLKTWTSMELRYQKFLFSEGVPYYDIINEQSWSMTFGSKQKVDTVPVFYDKLAKCGVLVKSLSFYDHHLCHAASAYYTSGYSDALVITADGVGDGRSASAYIVVAGEWKEVSSTLFPHSAGHMYGWATRLLGYKPSRHEGKLTGLAAFGCSEHLVKLKGKFLRYESDTKSLVNPYVEEGKCRISLLERLHSKFNNKAVHPSYKAFCRVVDKYYGQNYRSEDVAALAQDEIEQAVVEWCTDLIKETGIQNIALAGGVFANVKLNQRIEEIVAVDNLWVYPDMGDGGLSVGAAYLELYSQRKIESVKLKDICLGPEFSDEQIEVACRSSGLPFQYEKGIAKVVAKMLADGVIVGWFQGKMECGPRALGHRSILIHPGMKEMNSVVNERLNRTEFMPFAPSVLSEFFKDVFLNECKSENASKFMTVTYNVRKEWVDKLSAVVHVDHTARPQVVYQEVDPLYWDVIHEFYKITGLPAVVNTSFNMHEEPIVCTPNDAIRSFKKGAVDVLVLGNIIVTKEKVNCLKV